jgi:hypothetical protein
MKLLEGTYRQNGPGSVTFTVHARKSVWRLMWEMFTGRFESPRPRHKVKCGRRSK